MHADATSVGASNAGRSGALQLRARLALYAAAAALLFLVERWVPNPLPWVRLGLANIVTILVLVQYGFRAATVVVALRLLLGGFFGGTLFGPQFALALSGSVSSLVIMSVAQRLGPRLWSALGLSVLGSSAHAVAQLAAVAVLFTGAGIFSALPLFLVLSLVTGCITGVLADVLLARLDSSRAAPDAVPPST